MAMMRGVVSFHHGYDGRGGIIHGYDGRGGIIPSWL